MRPEDLRSDRAHVCVPCGIAFTDEEGWELGRCPGCGGILSLFSSLQGSWPFEELDVFAEVVP